METKATPLPPANQPEPIPTKWDHLDPIATIKQTMAEKEASAAPNELTLPLPAELEDLGCFIEAGRLKIPRENAAKVRRVIAELEKAARKANRKGDGKPLMVAKIPTKRV